MKIAVIQRQGSVGGWRWISGVFGAIKQFYPDIEISVYCEKNVALPEKTLLFLKDNNINVNFILLPKMLDEFKFKNKFKNKFINNLCNNFRKQKFTTKQNEITNNLIKLINKEFDIVFCSWPYTMEPIKFNIPSFFIPHDFIFTHFFGLHVGNAYNQKLYLKTRNILNKYLCNAYIPCVSSNYIANELRRTFPEFKKEVHVVPLAMMNRLENISETDKNKIMDKFEIYNEYILLITNDMHHKNMEEALTAYYYVKKKYSNLKMIIVGFGTEDIKVQMNSPFYGDHVLDDGNWDVKGVGLVSEEELVAILKNAKLLLNVSLCEAACGSGLDAWQLGIPTAISEIPPYIEQVEFLGVKTEFFNPKNSETIAESILRILDNPDYAKKNAEISRKALHMYTSKDVAEKYINIFKKHIKKENL